MAWMFTQLSLIAGLGLIVGVFLNVCADSLSHGGRLQANAFARPTCPYCRRPRPLVAWSGVVAYVSQHYRCPFCGAPIAIRHVAVELVTALLFASCWLRNGETGDRASSAMFLQALYGTVFILVTVTDLEQRSIPHAVMLPAIALAAAGAFLNPAAGFPAKGLLGGGIGLLSALALYFLGGAFARAVGRIRQQPVTEVAFGFGDVTLITFIGLVSGAPEILFALAIGLLSGGGFAAVLLLIRAAVQHKYTPLMTMPYGPFLILGGAVMLYLPEFMAWYAGR